MSDHVHDPPGTWAPVRRAATALASPLQRILQIEATSGLVLLGATIVALVWANLAPGSYESVWHVPISASVGSWSFDRPLHFWINDGLMTVFFFVAGLEIRRELADGELSTARKASLPLVAAIGGMLVPAVVFVAFNAGRAGAAGWAIPMATDIAFAVGVLALLGPRVPPALRVMLLSLAVIDDIGAILVIAMFYSDGIAIGGFGIVALGMALVLVLRAAGARSVWLYVIPGVLAWSGFHAAGIHPTVAGVLLGLVTPVRPWFGASRFVAATTEQLANIDGEDRDHLLSKLDTIEHARREAVSPADRLLHSLHPWVAFGIMPLFALANAGIEISGTSLDGDSAWLLIGIVAGLVAGKSAGIFFAASLATRLRIATSAPELSRRGFLLVGFVGGIGFTMSLFIAQLAFPPGPLLDTAKLAILIGSATAIVIALWVGIRIRR